MIVKTGGRSCGKSFLTKEQQKEHLDIQNRIKMLEKDVKEFYKYKQENKKEEKEQISYKGDDNNE